MKHCDSFSQKKKQGGGRVKSLWSLGAVPARRGAEVRVSKFNCFVGPSLFNCSVHRFMVVSIHSQRLMLSPHRRDK